VEVMGRDAGYIALDVGLGGGAEAILVPEMHTDTDLLSQVLQKGWGRKKGSQLIVVAEGDDAGGVFKVVEKLKQKVPALDPRMVVLGHIQRGGSPTAKDRILASRLGAAATSALIDGKTNVAIGIVNSNIHFVSLKDAVEKKKPVNKALLELADILSS
jgi:6-phosphofructokinase 1